MIEEEVDLVRDMYGRGDGLGVSLVGEGSEGGTDDVDRWSSKFMLPGIISIPKSSVKGRGGGRSTMASRS